MTQDIIISLIALTVLEIVLGIDNIIFISILANKAPGESNSKRADMDFYWAWW